MEISDYWLMRLDLLKYILIIIDLGLLIANFVIICMHRIEHKDISKRTRLVFGISFLVISLIVFFLPSSKEIIKF